MGMFDWVFLYVIIFLLVQFQIQLASVSYRDKTVRSVASPPTRSVNKPRGIHICIRDQPYYAICVLFKTRLYY